MAAGAVQMLQKSIMEAQKDLSSTDDAIKRLIGRDPNARPPPRRISGGPGPDRRISGGNGPERRTSGGDRRTSGGPGPDRRLSNGGRMRAWSGSYESPPAAKRRDTEGGRTRVLGRLGSAVEEPKRRMESTNIRSRLAGRLGPPPAGEDSEGEEQRIHKRPVLQSSVVATKVPPRPTVTNEDDNSKKRNRRMFGFLMGTLQKFKAAEDSAKTTEKERRRMEIEEKVEQIQVIEKEEAIQARKELFERRKQHKNKIAWLSGQVEAVSMYDEWNAHDKLMEKYIRTKAKPEVFYLPVGHTPQTEQAHAETKALIEEKIEKRQREIEELLRSQEEDQQQQQNAEEVADKVEPMEGEGENVEGGGVMRVEAGGADGSGRHAPSDSGEASE